MATLPDLDTIQVSFISYWNALDHGVTDIAPNDVITHANVNSYTLYDNGVTVQFELDELRHNRVITVRVKEDGWFVAYLDRTEEEKQLIEDDTQISVGPWDILNAWTNYSANSEVEQNTLERAIRVLAGELNNFGSITYNVSDVGLYNYEYTDATTITHLTWQRTGGGGSPRFMHSSSTTLDYAWCLAAGWCDHNESDGNGDSNLEIQWSDGTFLVDLHNQESTPEWGNLELLNAGLIPDSDTNYGNDITENSWHNNDESRAEASILIMWH